MQQEVQSWRELLGRIIHDPKEKQRIIDELAISAITLTRWVNGETEPRLQNIRHLLAILPHHRELFLHLLRNEEWFRGVTASVPGIFATHIPPDFYARVLLTRATTTEQVRTWSLCQIILQQALQQLDAEHQGMAVWVVCCMPPSGPLQKVRSLRETLGLGTPPWSSSLEQKAMFLGAESLAGNVVTLCRPGVIQDLDEGHNLIPATQVDYEKSAATYPILFAGRIAGVFMVSSTQKNFFLPTSRTNLVQYYAELLALAFEPEDFFAPEQVELGVMPPHNEQKRYFARFRQLVSDLLHEAASKQKPLNTIQADMLVWQRLEEELLNLPANDGL